MYSHVVIVSRKWGGSSEDSEGCQAEAKAQHTMQTAPPVATGVAPSLVLCWVLSFAQILPSLTPTVLRSKNLTCIC